MFCLYLCLITNTRVVRVQELDDGQAAIVRVMEQLDSRKDEILARTFRDVSAAFEDVFKELVPGGHGALKMIHNTIEDFPEPYIGVKV